MIWSSSAGITLTQSPHAGSAHLPAAQREGELSALDTQRLDLASHAGLAQMPWGHGGNRGPTLHLLFVFVAFLGLTVSSVAADLIPVTTGSCDGTGPTCYLQLGGVHRSDCVAFYKNPTEGMIAGINALNDGKVSASTCALQSPVLTCDMVPGIRSSQRCD